MIFLSYRIEDSLHMVARLDADLTARFGKDAVYRDMTRTGAGAQWDDTIEANARSCSVMLVIIGTRWRTVLHDAGDWEGVPRLFDPQDWVRREVRLALNHSRLVIPVLLDDTTMPPAGWLANCELDGLAARQGRRLRARGFDYGPDLERLVDEITAACPHLTLAASAAEATKPMPAADRELPLPTQSAGASLGSEKRIDSAHVAQHAVDSLRIPLEATMMLRAEGLISESQHDDFVESLLKNKLIEGRVHDE